MKTKCKVFQLWKNGKCFSQRQECCVKEEYQDMEVGDCRILEGSEEDFNAVEIWRVK